MRKKLLRFLPLFIWAVVVISVVMTTGCGGNDQNAGNQNTENQNAGEEESQDQTEKSAAADDNGQTAYPFTFTDSLGDEVTVEEEPEKIISLSPSNTEILFAVGAGERVIGRTDYCSYPEEASEVESIGTYTSPNTELIISMEPDIVFASDYVDDSIRQQVEAAGAKMVVFSAASVEGVEELILQAGEILNLNENAREVVGSMDARLKKIQESVPSEGEGKSVFIDIGSFYSAGPGSLLDDMLNQIGAVNVAADTGETWPQLSVESIVEKNPDVYISLYTAQEELDKTAGLKDLDCMKGDSFIYFQEFSNESDMIQRAGPRVVDGIEVLADRIYGKQS